MVKPSKKEQLAKAFKIIIKAYLIEWNIPEGFVDNLVKHLIREVTVRTNLK